MNKDILKIEPQSPMEKAQTLMELEALNREIYKKIKQLKDELLKATQELDVLSLKTGSYTISRVKRITPRVEDFEKLKISLEKAGVPYETKEVFADQMNIVFREAIKEGKEFKGLDKQETEYVMIRINKKGVNKK